jgi:hypothetical protein
MHRLPEAVPRRSPSRSRTSRTTSSATVRIYVSSRLLTSPDSAWNRVISTIIESRRADCGSDVTVAVVCDATALLPWTGTFASSGSVPLIRDVTVTERESTKVTQWWSQVVVSKLTRDTLASPSVDSGPMSSVSNRPSRILGQEPEPGPAGLRVTVGGPGLSPWKPAAPVRVRVGTRTRVAFDQKSGLLVSLRALSDYSVTAVKLRLGAPTRSSDSELRLGAYMIASEPRALP